MLLLTELLKDWPCTVSGKGIRAIVAGITETASTVKAGYIFIARKGVRDDGALYIAEAVERGAVAIVVDRAIEPTITLGVPVVTVPDCRKFLSYASARFAGNPSERLKVIAVTGTNGKTTVTHFIGQLLKRHGVRTAVIGTTGIFVDGVQMMFNAPKMTTLPAEYLHPLLALCEEAGVTHIVLEASSVGLSTCRLDHCQIDIGILLNIGVDHYEEHGGQEAYIQAKKKLVHLAKTIIVNGEDAHCVAMAKDAAVPKVYFGDNRVADCYLDDEQLQLSMPGNYNRRNALAASSALVILGYQLDKVLPFCPLLQLPEGRLQQMERGGVTVFIDYAHTPDALEAVLQTLSGICQGKLITVFGCGGERDRGKRREMGELAVFYSASVIVTSDNPRSEDPLAIIADIMSGFGGECTAAEAVPDRKNAIRQAVFYAAPGDIVLIAGKGHEKTQHTAVGLISFSDFEVAQQALREKIYIHPEETSPE
ncbi:UDP-N-acetylmuramoyl-L-alanyl-D-glutamate--2,6-diaminopimelate ligase [Sporosarcina sp. FSL K6-1522]|uniref:UDP-N-acetylmuramoyl-L-alanyl-D-glutamate--2, 6-diaminopimelate ligase n=1 Tax=Sporosarcina sp. FSL K6-1522 TaxID=2921554 RepID=UPI00315AE662